jgi:hypothetical protein
LKMHWKLPFSCTMINECLPSLFNGKPILKPSVVHYHSTMMVGNTANYQVVVAIDSNYYIWPISNQAASF